MRTRSELEAALTTPHSGSYETDLILTNQKLLLEVLLDIRNMLAQNWHTTSEYAEKLNK